MKRLFTSVFIFLTLFCFTACAVPSAGKASRANNLGCAFTSTVTMTLDKLTADGTITRFGDGEWEIEFDSPNTLSGVKLAFSEGDVSASYKGLSFSVPRSALPVKAMLLNLIEAVDTNARAEELDGSESDGVFSVNGTLEGGDYTITVDENGCISSFEMPNSLLFISFNELTVNGSSLSDPAETTVSEESGLTASETTAAEETQPAGSSAEQTVILQEENSNPEED